MASMEMQGKWCQGKWEMVSGEMVSGTFSSIVCLLVNILENQPIENPTADITHFAFLPAAPRCVRGVAYFAKPINGYDHYTFGNAFA